MKKNAAIYAFSAYMMAATTGTLMHYLQADLWGVMYLVLALPSIILAGIADNSQ